MVWNLEADSEQARLTLPDGLSWGGWSAPPVSLSGDIVYVGTSDTARAVNWRTGEITETDTVDAGVPQVFGGRAESDGRVVDLASGETLLQIEGEDAYLSLSPDGRFAMANTYDGDQPVRVYDLAAKAHVDIDGARARLRLERGRRLFTVDGHQLTTCSPTTGDCETTDVDLVKEPQDSQGEMSVCDEGGKCTPVGPPPDYSGEPGSAG